MPKIPQRIGAGCLDRAKPPDPKVSPVVFLVGIVSNEPYSGVSQLSFAAATSDGLVATKPGSPGYDHSFALAGEPEKTSKDKQTITASFRMTVLLSLAINVTR